MKPFFSRLASSHPLALITGACLIALTIPAYRLLDAQRQNVGAIDRAMAREGRETRAFLGRWLTENLMPTLNYLPPMLDEHATRIETLTQQEIRHGVDTSAALLRETAAMADQRAQQALGQVVELRGDLGPVLANAAALEASYAALPDRIGATLEPWRVSIEPEITCRQMDGSGYGGCWHARITALMGEAARVGGVFAQHFPSYANSMDQTAKSLNGMVFDAHQWTAKYVQPHPLSFKQKLGVAGKVTVGLGTAALRGGVF